MKEQTRENIKKIIKKLKEIGDWIHIRELARQCNLKPGSVWYYLNRYPQLFNIDYEARKKGKTGRTIILFIRWKK